MGFDCPDLLSFDSRSVLDHFSLVPRSSLVRLSLLIRLSIEDRTRTERGTSKKRTKEQRTSVEKPTRNYRKLDEELPYLMGKAAFWFPTLSQISWTELLLSLQDVVRYATWCPQGVTLGYGNLWAFSPPLLACNSVLSSVCSVCSVDPCDLLLVGTKSIQKPRRRSVNFSQAFQLFQFQLCFRGSVKFQTPFLRLITN